MPEIKDVIVNDNSDIEDFKEMLHVLVKNNLVAHCPQCGAINDVKRCQCVSCNSFFGTEYISPLENKFSMTCYLIGFASAYLCFTCICITNTLNYAGIFFLIALGLFLVGAIFQSEDIPKRITLKKAIKIREREEKRDYKIMEKIKKLKYKIKREYCSI